MLSSKLILPFSAAAIILVVGGVFAWSQMNQAPAPVATPTLAPSPIPAPTPQPAPEIPADWQTYRNEEFGFEIKYPSDLVLLREDASTFVSFGRPNQIVVGENSFDIKILRTITEQEALKEARIWKQNEIIQLQRNEPGQFPLDFNAEEFTQAQEYWLLEPVSVYPTPVHELIINGKKTLVGNFDVRLSNTEDGYIGLGTNSVSLLFGENNTYALVYASFEADSEALRQILSSFRFLK